MRVNLSENMAGIDLWKMITSAPAAIINAVTQGPTGKAVSAASTVIKTIQDSPIDDVAKEVIETGAAPVLQLVIPDTVSKKTTVSVPQIEAPKYETLVVPGYKKTETGEIVKESSIAEDLISMIPLSGLALFAFLL